MKLSFYQIGNGILGVVPGKSALGGTQEKMPRKYGSPRPVISTALETAAAVVVPVLELTWASGLHTYSCPLCRQALADRGRIGDRARLFPRAISA